MRYFKLSSGRLAAGAGALFLAVVGPIYVSFSGKVGDYLWKNTEAHLPTSPATTAASQPNGPGLKQIDNPVASSDPSAPEKPFITMSSNSGISNMTILLGKNRGVGILNDGVDGAKFKDLSVKNAGIAGIVNKNSSNLEFNNVDVEMAPTDVPERGN